MERKIGVTEKDILLENNKKFIKEATIVFDPHTNKGQGVSQIIDGLKRILR